MERRENMEYPNNDLKTSVVFPIYLCSKELIRKYGEELKKYDLTYTQYIVLMYFINEKESNLKRIGDTMLLDSSTLTPLLKKMEKKGYITRKKSKTDERNLTLTITKKGLELEPELREIPPRIKDLFNLSEKEIATLHKITYKILNNIVEDR
jgi:DNA-binding MarR family transcriptional regulator